MSSLPAEAPRLASPVIDHPVARLRSLLRPATRRLSAPLEAIQTAGWVALVLIGAALWLGRRYGWLEVWALAVCVGALVVLAVALVLGRIRYQMDLDLADRRVVVGTRTAGTVTVTNLSRRALLPAQIELPVGAGLAHYRVPRLAGQAEHEELFIVPTSRRGVFTVGPVSAVRADPLGLFRREVRWQDTVDLFVHPRTVALDGASAGFLRDIEGLPTQDLSSNDVSFHALREYVAGDDRRAIHWRTTARVGRLMVRQFEETRRSHLAVTLSCSPADFGDSEEFELAVSVAASLGLQAIKEEKSLTVLAGEEQLLTVTGGQLLDEFAGVRFGASPEQDITSLARVTSVKVPEASVVVLVVGSSTTAAELRAASVQLPLGVQVLAVRCVPGEQVSRRVIGGLTVVTVGVLTDLPRVMRRVAR